MIDHIGRKIDYLRISVTDRCNLRCRYCMPEDGVSLLSHEEILTFLEVERIATVMARLGVQKIKLTGGEPLVRKGIVSLVRSLNQIQGIQDVTMTSNGYLLPDMSMDLAEAGLSSVNISLDTLDPAKFHEITRRDYFDAVMKGIDSAICSGLKVKINCAVMEELTPDAIREFAEFSIRKSIPVRFIEMMPIGQGSQYTAMDNSQIVRILRESYDDLTPVAQTQGYGNGPAIYYKFQQGQGCVGLISAVHHKFCHSCNRVRLTSEGFLKLCLASAKGTDLKGLIRQGMTDEALEQIILEQMKNKPMEHRFGEVPQDIGLNMNQIGG